MRTLAVNYKNKILFVLILQKNSCFIIYFCLNLYLLIYTIYSILQLIFTIFRKYYYHIFNLLQYY